MSGAETEAMFLKNYTSDVPVHITIGRIEAILLRCGVQGITKEYGPAGKVAAMIFRMPMPDGRPVSIRLPANADKVLIALWDNYIQSTGVTRRKTQDDFKDQAERTAWKLMEDWVAVQMSLVAMEQVELAQVFLAFVWDPQRHITFFDDLKQRGFKGLLPENTDR